MKRFSKIIFTISLISFSGVLALGGWWLFLVVKLSSTPEAVLTTDFIKLAKWEGGTFILLLTSLTSSFYYLYYKDLRKTKSIQNFFSGLTHELKTPLASIRLQGEVLQDKLNLKDSDNMLLDRLIDDTQNLEIQMDKIIQLSRVERDRTLNLTRILIEDELKRIVRQFGGNLSVELLNLGHHEVQADSFALELIFKNLFENTKHHSNNDDVKIILKKTETHIMINYNDNGDFQGDTKKIGKLFYTHHKTRGSGIGLYLSKKLTLLMNGQFNISTKPTFSVTITLPLLKKELK
jgi:signal transduction histidine kinase